MDTKDCISPQNPVPRPNISPKPVKDDISRPPRYSKIQESPSIPLSQAPESTPQVLPALPPNAAPPTHSALPVQRPPDHLSGLCGPVSEGASLPPLLSRPSFSPHRVTLSKMCVRAGHSPAYTHHGFPWSKAHCVPIPTNWPLAPAKPPLPATPLLSHHFSARSLPLLSVHHPSPQISSSDGPSPTSPVLPYEAPSPLPTPVTSNNMTHCSLFPALILRVWAPDETAQTQPGPGQVPSPPSASLCSLPNGDGKSLPHRERGWNQAKHACEAAQWPRASPRYELLFPASGYFSLRLSHSLIQHPVLCTQQHQDKY